MNVITPTSTFTRPGDTTTYGDGDLVANSTTAGSVAAMSFNLNGIGRSGLIRRARIYKSTTTATAATFSIHLFDSEPTVSNGDNGAFSVATNIDSWLGKIAVDMSSGAEAGAAAGLSQVSAAVAIGVNKEGPTDRLIYGLIEAGGTYAPGSAETFTVRLEIEG